MTRVDAGLLIEISGRNLVCLNDSLSSWLPRCLPLSVKTQKGLDYTMLDNSRKLVAGQDANSKSSLLQSSLLQSNFRLRTYDLKLVSDA